MKPLAIASIACFALLTQIAPAQSHRTGDDNPDVIAIRQYRLTMDKVDKLAAATDQMNKLRAANPELKKRMDASGDDAKTIDQKVANIDTKFPEAVAVLRANGLSTRDYIMVSLAFMNDMIMVGSKKSGMIKEYPPNSITPENIAFCEQNYDKLKQIGDKLSPPDSEQ